MEPPRNICGDMKLYNAPNAFYIEAADDPQDVLVISKDGSKPHINPIKDFTQPTYTYRSVCGILGIIRLLSGNHLVVATHRIHVGEINNRDIFQLAGFDIIPFIETTDHLSPQQVDYNKRYMQMFKNVLETPYLYFSYQFDLTRTIQDQYDVAPELLKISNVKRADDRFLWNGYLLRDLKDEMFQKYALPLIHGFISINYCNINGRLFTWSLISRRSLYRAGPRLFKRGIDKSGNVANYVETEQIVEYKGSISAFVQTRGSIPLFWHQLPNLKYKPRPKLSSDDDHMAACRMHFNKQIEKYGQQVLINLIDQRGSEEALETGYRNAVTQMSEGSVRYESFDFHAECRNLKWHRLSILIDRLAHEQDEFQYFMLGNNGVLLSLQNGVFRTNCIDCLDRTNVVQSLLARRSLDSVLRRFQIFSRSDDSIARHDNFESLFKTVWADNADFVSVQYSGTGALKNDFTRTGKRTKVGLLRDLYNSARRYYKNNFSDGFRQDSIDLFLGNYEISEGEGVTIPCPLRNDKDWKYFTFPSILLIAIAMFFASVIFPNDYSTEVLLYLMFWGVMIASTFTIIFKYGKEFVDYPKLSDLNMPSFRAGQPEHGFPF